MTTTTMKTAIVTGGCSGIGLGLVKHLLSQPDWRVVIADIRADAYPAIAGDLGGDSIRHVFVATDVGSWESQAALFREAFAWSGGRIDFLAANAGVAEKEHIALANPAAADYEADEPSKPPMLCTQVNQIGVFYGLKLFIHYSRRTARGLLKTSSLSQSAVAAAGYNPKMVITSSCAGLYPFSVAPEYCATKHAVLGLTRAVGRLLYETDNIAVNCINPAYVETGLSPASVTAGWPREYITPVSTMVRAFVELISETGRVEGDGKSEGVDGQVKTGQSVECVVDRLFYRKPPDYADESQRFLIEQTLDLQTGLWWKGARELFAKRQQQPPISSQ
ncbi:hypothetical protein AYO20_01739 [Fonsecaea nubica]|uniref:Uncharacterized protein n=1 Tax=Fonsecaea nubica TaxID=856822 RepID=A0A178DA92_9EURO|nr:hypothetical protein AYO20_01739 [Fonsecaea nubica]OAL38988.1 hypothetical protein AYO20_01739 [Fonsecaea nubica]